MHSTEDPSQADGVGQICLLRRSIKVGEVDASRRTRTSWRTRDLEGLRISHSLRVMYPYCREFECHFGFRAPSCRCMPRDRPTLAGDPSHGGSRAFHAPRIRAPLYPPTRIEDVLVVLPSGQPGFDWLRRQIEWNGTSTTYLRCAASALHSGDPINAEGTPCPGDFFVSGHTRQNSRNWPGESLQDRAPCLGGEF
ncbi:hypothetical protein I6F26_24285 [Ensifer sp. IC3342]|nr:hypothetical protein [Ensifer sp. BRP08]MCA1449695.1 hypothetical protein [Ensifer sp. IC3342]